MDTLLTIFIPIIICAVGIYLFWRYKNNKEAKQNTEYSNPDFLETNSKLLTNTLKKLHLSYEKINNDKSFAITYQGEHFIIYDLDNGPFINIADTWWYDSPLDDIENLTLIRKAVNECNYHTGAKLMYAINKEKQVVGIHSMATIFWKRQIPDIENYFCSMLTRLLQTHQLFFREMEELRRDRYKTDKNER